MMTPIIDRDPGDETPEHPCQAIVDRAELTIAIRLACEPNGKEPMSDGSEEDLIRWFEILTGIVNEYRDGGDQMVENCTCGDHR
jgi:hypothetical protein